jgi:hypothetical protein
MPQDFLRQRMKFYPPSLLPPPLLLVLLQNQNQK